MITGNEPIQAVYGADGCLMKMDAENENWINQCAPMIGLTIRQHFAAMAMQGLAANPEYYRKIGQCQSGYYASQAVALADALINELNKTQP